VDKIIRKSPVPSGKGQQESSSFLKKSKKTFDYVEPNGGLREKKRSVPQRAKVFWFFFSKKNCFLRTCFPLPAARFISVWRIILRGRQASDSLH
jgi:hypothetical protein